MRQAYCKECNSPVVLADQGTCPRGHAAASLSGIRPCTAAEARRIVGDQEAVRKAAAAAADPRLAAILRGDRGRAATAEARKPVPVATFAIGVGFLVLVLIGIAGFALNTAHRTQDAANTAAPVATATPAPASIVPPADPLPQPRPDTQLTRSGSSNGNGSLVPDAQQRVLDASPRPADTAGEPPR